MKKMYLLAGLAVGILVISAASVVYAANNNYGAWRATMGNKSGRAASVITEQNFDKFTKMHELMGQGNYTEAQKLRTELGLGQGQGKGAAGCGMKNGAGLKQGGCSGRNGEVKAGANFVDANKNGVCDHAEALVK